MKTVKPLLHSHFFVVGLHRALGSLQADFPSDGEHGPVTFFGTGSAQ